MSKEEDDRLRRILNSEEETQGVYNPAPVEPPSQITDKYYRPALDEDNMPLPRRVDEIDMEGTRVTRAAYQTTRSQQPEPMPGVMSTPPSQPRNGSQSKVKKLNWRGNWGCLLRGLIALTFVAVVIGLIVGSYFVYKYYSIASTLPEVGDLRSRASQFETTRILDRNGQVLYEILDPNAGRRTYIPISEISPNLLAATIATEDKDFNSHPGFDLFAMIRALWQIY